MIRRTAPPSYEDFDGIGVGTISGITIAEREIYYDGQPVAEPMTIGYSLRLTEYTGPGISGGNLDTSVIGTDPVCDNPVMYVVPDCYDLENLLGRFHQQPGDLLLYTLDYTPYLQLEESEYLATTPTITITPVTDPPLVRTPPAALPRPGSVTGYEFNVGGGVAGQEYVLTIVTDTNLGRRVERRILYSIEEA